MIQVLQSNFIMNNSKQIVFRADLPKNEKKIIEKVTSVLCPSDGITLSNKFPMSELAENYHPTHVPLRYRFKLLKFLLFGCRKKDINKWLKGL